MSKLFEQEILLRAVKNGYVLRLENNGEYFAVSGALEQSDNDLVFVSKDFEDFEEAKKFYDHKTTVFFKEAKEVLESDKCNRCSSHSYRDEKVIACENCGNIKKQTNKNYW